MTQDHKTARDLWVVSQAETRSMSMSQKTFTLSKPIGNEPIALAVKAYFRARNRNNLYDAVIREFQDSGLSQATLARRLNKRPEVINRLLGAPGNWTLDTVSDLLLAISGSEVNYTIARPFEKPPRNYVMPDTGLRNRMD